MAQWEESGFISFYLSKGFKKVYCLDWLNHGSTSDFISGSSKSSGAEATAADIPTIPISIGTCPPESSRRDVNDVSDIVPLIASSEERAQLELEYYSSQLEDVIRFLARIDGSTRNLSIHSFSMGVLICLDYLQGKCNFSLKSGGEGDILNITLKSLVLHSPWDGYVPDIFKMVLRIPTTVNLLRSSYFKNCNSDAALSAALSNLQNEELFPMRNVFSNDRLCYMMHRVNIPRIHVVVGALEFPFKYIAEKLYTILSSPHCRPPVISMYVCPFANHDTFVTSTFVANKLQHSIAKFLKSEH